MIQVQKLFCFLSWLPLKRWSPRKMLLLDFADSIGYYRFHKAIHRGYKHMILNYSVYLKNQLFSYCEIESRLLVTQGNAPSLPPAFSSLCSRARLEKLLNLKKNRKIFMVFLIHPPTCHQKYKMMNLAPSRVAFMTVSI